MAAEGWGKRIAHEQKRGTLFSLDYWQSLIYGTFLPTILYVSIFGLAFILMLFLPSLVIVIANYKNGV